MLTREIAKYQIQDRVGAAQRDRARSLGAGRSSSGSREAVRKVGSGMLASVVGRRRKTTPTSTPIGLPLA